MFHHSFSAQYENKASHMSPLSNIVQPALKIPHASQYGLNPCSCIWSPWCTKAFLPLARQIFIFPHLSWASRKQSRTLKICVLCRYFHCLFYFSLSSPSPICKYKRIKVAFFRSAVRLCYQPPLPSFSKTVAKQKNGLCMCLYPWMKFSQESAQLLQ